LRVRIHDAITLGDDIEEVTHRRLAQPIDVIGRRHRITPLDDHAIAIAGAPMTNRAVDLKPLATSLQYLAGNGEWKRFDQIRANFSGKERLVFVQLAARHRVGDDWPGGHAISEKLALRE